MDANEELQLNAEIKLKMQEYLDSIRDRVIELYKQAIQNKLYNYYTPNTYDRTYDYLNSVNVQIVNNKLYVFADMNEGMGHYSTVTGEDESANINNWVINGHNDDSNVYNEYHHYEGRDILDYAQELIQSEFPDLQVKIMNDGQGFTDISELL
jgi:hypothetical protein